jgi:transposase-like protein
MFSLFSIIGSIQGGESYDYNPNIYNFDTDQNVSDFGTHWFIRADDEDQAIPREKEQMTYPLGAWSTHVEAEQVRDETEPSVETPEKRKYRAPYDAAVKISVLEFCKENKIMAASRKFGIAYPTIWQWLNPTGRVTCKRFTEKIKAEALKLYEDGTPISEVCGTFGMCESTLRKWRKRKRESGYEDSDTGVNKKIKRKKYDEEFKKGMIKLYAEEQLKGTLISDFCREQGIPRSTFGDWVHKKTH